VKFWEDCWVGGRALKLSFIILYLILEDKGRTIKEVGESESRD